MPTGQTAVQHGCNGMDGKGKGENASKIDAHDAAVFDAQGKASGLPFVFPFVPFFTLFNV